MGGKTKTTSSISPEILSKQIGVFDRAQGIADQPFHAYAAPRFAGFNPDQTASFQAYRDIAGGNAGAGYLDEAAAGARDAAAYQPAMVQAGMLRDLDLSPYTNRWDNAVVDASNADVEHARQIQRVQDQASATAAGAWGGSRQGVADALTNEAALREAGGRSAQLRQQGYSNAQQLGMADLNRRLSADQGNQGAGLQGAQLRLSAAGILGDLSSQQLQQAITRAGLLGQIGDAQQALDQKGLDSNYEEFMRQAQDPYTKQALLGSALGGIQAPTTSTEKMNPGAYQYLQMASDLAGKLYGGTHPFMS